MAGHKYRLNVVQVKYPVPTSRVQAISIAHAAQQSAYTRRAVTTREIVVSSTPHRSVNRHDAIAILSQNQPLKWFEKRGTHPNELTNVLVDGEIVNEDSLWKRIRDEIEALEFGNEVMNDSRVQISRG